MNEAIQVTVDNDVTFIDVATLLTGIALVVGAFLAYFQTKRQIAQAELHHDTQLKASLRPLVLVPHAEARYFTVGTSAGTTVHLYVDAWLQNVGPGPALAVELLGWLRVPDAAAQGRHTEIEHLKSQIDVNAPELRARVAGLGANSDALPAPLVIARDDIVYRDYAADRGVLLYTCRYQDVFKNQFPSVPIGGLDLGSIDIVAQGSWRERP